VFVERVWRAGDHRQAEDRIHRIGQTGQATIWYLDVPETFDEALRAIQEWKAERADAITDGIEIGQSDEAPTAIDAFNDYFKNREKK
jgi:SNF2 family DNA or RNA helicase